MLRHGHVATWYSAVDAGNLDTMGKIAFAVGQPGHPFDQNEFLNFAQNTRGAMIHDKPG